MKNNISVELTGIESKLVPIIIKLKESDNYEKLYQIACKANETMVLAFLRYLC